jgi:hypothetical protein
MAAGLPGRWVHSDRSTPSCHGQARFFIPQTPEHSPKNPAFHFHSG